MCGKVIKNMWDGPKKTGQDRAEYSAPHRTGKEGKADNLIRDGGCLLPFQKGKPRSRMERVCLQGWLESVSLAVWSGLVSISLSLSSGLFGEFLVWFGLTTPYFTYK